MNYYSGFNNYGKKKIIIETDNSNYWRISTITTQGNPCEYCTNNPKNNPNASGICWCALPSMNNVVY